MANRPASRPWPGAMTRVSSTTSRRELRDLADRREDAAARPPARSLPVVWSLAPVSRMLSGTLNMSTIVVLQNIPEALYVNSAQSCSTRVVRVRRHPARRVLEGGVAVAVRDGLELELLAERHIDPAGHVRQRQLGLTAAGQADGVVGEAVGAVVRQCDRREGAVGGDAHLAAVLIADDVDVDVRVAEGAAVVDDASAAVGRRGTRVAVRGRVRRGRTGPRWRRRGRPPPAPPRARRSLRRPRWR